ncbi:MAG TPA: DUF459 domain-containing protein [Aliidongia sp.]|uniref:SGNH/GDSL hydrolase family protein n=1 Tax=Aliidongia sp. TaxID=1914230 RepID=UPI002DDD1A8C|nr:DUF459 domain-containing protein [Aliidongia sp.]HEV2675481.1 DUF459 domain-containing protein [Aliidongia sp.]
MFAIGRLGFCLGALALSLVPSPGRAADSRNIAVFGDSLADGAWAGLHQELHPDDKLFRDSKVGTGLTKPDIRSFVDGFADTLDRDHVTVAVVMFGANDEESLRDDDHKGFVFQSPGWTRVYVSRIEQIIEACRQHKVRVIWVGLPVLRDDTLNKGALFLNGLLQDTVVKNGGTFVSLTEDFKGSDGAFASHLPDAKGELREVRLQDGVHFTFYGYGLIAKKIYKELAVVPATAAHDAPPAAGPQN